MRTAGMLALCGVLCATGRAGESGGRAVGAARRGPANRAEAVRAQPKLLEITGRIDGSGRIVFTRGSVRYEHRHWGRPTDLRFDGEPWPRPEATPAAWGELGAGLDLTRAWIVARQGRDVIALEHTADGFDLYLCDSPNGGVSYRIVIAIPRRG